MGVVTSLGWRDRATRLLLLEAYVRSCLLFGSSVWGVEFLGSSPSVATASLGSLDVFYRRTLRSMMGLPATLRNELVYVLTGRFPLAVYVGKSLLRFQASLASSDRLASSVYRWVWDNVECEGHRPLLASGLGDFVSRTGSI